MVQVVGANVDVGDVELALDEFMIPDGCPEFVERDRKVG